MSTLMAVKVLGLIGLGAAVVWWQMRDLAKESKLTAERDAKLSMDKTTSQ